MLTGYLGVCEIDEILDECESFRAFLGVVSTDN